MEEIQTLGGGWRIWATQIPRVEGFLGFSQYACCGGRTPMYREPRLTCSNGTGCEEDVVNGHHGRGAVESRGLI